MDHDFSAPPRSFAPAKCQVSDAPVSTRMSVPEIARRLDIGRMAVYEMLEKRILPGIRVGRRWVVTRQAYEQCECTSGVTKAQQEAKFE